MKNMFTKAERVFLQRVQVTCSYLRNLNNNVILKYIIKVKRFSGQQEKFINTLNTFCDQKEQMVVTAAVPLRERAMQIG